MDYSLEKRSAGGKSLRVPRPKSSPVPASSPKPKTPTGTQQPAPAKQKPNEKAPIVYTDEKIQELLSDGYIKVTSSLWDYIPTGSHIRYLKRDDGSGAPKSKRFKPGGFVRSHFVTEDGKKMLMIENKPNGKRGDPGYVTFPVAYEDVEELWKKYDRFAFIEIHLIYVSLAQKKKQIEELSARVKTLEDILRSVVKK